MSLGVWPAKLSRLSERWLPCVSISSSRLLALRTARNVGVLKSVLVWVGACADRHERRDGEVRRDRRPASKRSIANSEQARGSVISEWRTKRKRKMKAEIQAKKVMIENDEAHVGSAGLTHSTSMMSLSGAS